MQFIKTALLLLVVAGMLACAGSSGSSLLSAKPVCIFPPRVSTLTWSVAGATAVKITPDVGLVNAQGSQNVSPSVTTLYTLVATLFSGKVVKSSALVTVDVPPVIHAYDPYTHIELQRPFHVVSGGTLLFGVSGGCFEF